jgi:hypothetical protein
LQEKRKSRVINASVLIITFAVMMAALAYNPNKVPEVTVHGTVTDVAGRPIENVSMQVSTEIDAEPQDSYVSTDANGHYSITVEHGGKLNIFANADSLSGLPYWVRVHDYDVSNNPSSLESDFVLQGDTNVAMPLGLVVVCDTINASTSNNISVDLRGLGLYIESDRMNTSFGISSMLGFCSRNDTYSFSSTDRTCMALYMNVTLSGMTAEDGSILEMYSKYVGDVYAKSIDPSPLDDAARSEHHKMYNLSRGQNITIKAIEEASTWELPGALNLSFPMDYLGDQITIQEKGISFSGIDLNISAGAVTIEPLTDGVHPYDVCVINGCIVHIREVATIR